MARKDIENFSGFSKEEKQELIREETKRLVDKKSKKPSVSPLPDSLRKQFAQLACELSPENLNEDGECSAARAQMKYIRIQTKWRKLEKLVGRKVAESEFF